MSKPNYDPNAIQSSEKLAVYTRYLQRYLNVMLNRTDVDEIHICDMLAGRGKCDSQADGGLSLFANQGEEYSKEAEGSALLAMNIIKETLKKFSKKEIRLYLNELESYDDLCNNISPKPEWVSCSNKDVNKAVDEYFACLNKDVDKLFYLDPFGYTQIKKESLDKIVRTPRTECLLFVPVTRISQFVNRNKPADEQAPGIPRFLKDYNIDHENYKQAKPSHWGLIIKEAFAKIYSKQYVGVAIFKAKNSNYYALYFIGNHFYGLEKFLESVKKLRILSQESEIESYLSEWRTNFDIYVWGLKNGWLPTKTNIVLTRMKEKNQLDIDNRGEKNNLGFFYLNHKPSKTIDIKLRREM